MDIAVADGRIARITPSVEAALSLVVPLLSDIHVHLDKTLTAHRLGARPRGLQAAIELAALDKARWTAEDIRARAGAALHEAYANGLGGLRTHVDWPEPAPPLAWEVIGELGADWRGRIDIERAALVPLDLLGDPDHGEAIARAVAASHAVLGAFVYGNADLEGKLARVFALARRFDLRLDFHVDEGLDPEARGFDAIVALTRESGMESRVQCGHACALSVRPEAEVARLLDAAARAGIGLTVLPTTNGWLQDAQPGRTPRLRGLAPVQEASAAGVMIAFGLDNVRDAFYPFGAYDLFDAWRLGILGAQLEPEDWLDSITSDAETVMEGAIPCVEEGARADFIHIALPSLDALVSQPRASRTVWRDGRPLGAPGRERVSA